MRRKGHSGGGDNLSLSASFGDDDTGSVVPPAEASARDWFNAAVGPGGGVPKMFDLFSGSDRVKLGRHDDQIDVAPLIWLTFGV